MKALRTIPCILLSLVAAACGGAPTATLLARILAGRFSNELLITFASMHPGWPDTTAVRTSLPKFHSVMRHVLRSAEEGADTVVWLAASDRARGTVGAFWFDRRVAPEYPLPWTRESPGLRQELFALCEKLSGVTFENIYRGRP